MHSFISILTGLAALIAHGDALGPSSGPPQGLGENCNNIGLTSYVNQAYKPSVWSSSTGAITYKAIALLTADSSTDASYIWASFFCPKTSSSGSGCANTTIATMLYNAIHDVSLRSLPANYANIQILNGSGLWQGYVGEDDGQGPSNNGASFANRLSSYPYEDPSEYNSPGFSNAGWYTGNALSLTCKNANGTAGTSLSPSDLTAMSYRISNRLIISNFLAWRFVIYNTANLNAFARCRITITAGFGGTVGPGTPDYIPNGGPTMNSNDGVYPIEADGANMPCSSSPGGS